MSGKREFSKDEAEEDSVNYQAKDALQYQQEGAYVAVIGQVLASKSDSGLHFDGEEKGRGEIHDVYGARVVDPAVALGNRDPQSGEEQPGKDVRGAEDEQDDQPVGVEERREAVLHEA